jgi:hypothetical protein
MNELGGSRYHTQLRLVLFRVISWIKLFEPAEETIHETTRNVTERF